MGRQDVLHNSAYLRERQRGVSPLAPLALEEAVGQCGQDDVALPAGQRAAFEMIEAEFVFELLVLLLDGPPLVRQNARAP